MPTRLTSVKRIIAIPNPPLRAVDDAAVEAVWLARVRRGILEGRGPSIGATAAAWMYENQPNVRRRAPEGVVGEAARATRDGKQSAELGVHEGQDDHDDRRDGPGRRSPTDPRLDSGQRAEQPTGSDDRPLWAHISPRNPMSASMPSNSRASPWIVLSRSNSHCTPPNLWSVGSGPKLFSTPDRRICNLGAAQMEVKRRLNVRRHLDSRQPCIIARTSVTSRPRALRSVRAGVQGSSLRHCTEWRLVQGCKPSPRRGVLEVCKSHNRLPRPPDRLKGPCAPFGSRFRCSSRSPPTAAPRASASAAEYVFWHPPIRPGSPRSERRPQRRRLYCYEALRGRVPSGYAMTSINPTGSTKVWSRPFPIRRR